MTQIAFGLLDNGLDFLDSALEGLTGNPTARSIKYATIHLGDGVELILKERLRRHDWRLLFADPRKATDVAYQLGAFRSAHVHDVIERLDEDCGVEIPAGSGEAFHALRDKRNRLEHFTISDTIRALQAVAAKVVHHLLSFIDAELQPFGFNSAEERLLESIRRRLSGFDDLVCERWVAIQPDVGGWKGGPVAGCPACLEEALLIGDDQPRCAFCGFRDRPESAANAYVENVVGMSSHRTIKDGGEWPIYKCDGCDAEAMVQSDGYVCFSCGFEAESLDSCSGCGRPYKLDDMAMCEDCFNAAVAKDD